MEQVLDAALSLEQYVDLDQPLRRERYPEYAAARRRRRWTMRFARASRRSTPTASAAAHRRARCARRCRRTRSATLWFIATYAPEMESWERDIFLAVREESFYFYPVFATQIMNEGWASYWHARLLREADFIPQEAYLDAIKCHSDVVRPVATGEQVALIDQSLSPGIHAVGGDRRRNPASRRRGASCARTMISASCAITSRARSPRRWGCSATSASSNGQVKVVAADIDELHESLLRRQVQLRRTAGLGGAKCATTARSVLTHDSQLDGRGLGCRAQRARCSSTCKRVWRRPMVLTTVNQAGSALEVTAP